MSANKCISIITDGVAQAKTMMPHFMMSANKHVSIIIDGMDQAKTMMPHFYYICKEVCI